jgi:hypothetical protein
VLRAAAAFRAAVEKGRRVGCRARAGGGTTPTILLTLCDTLGKRENDITFTGKLKFF